MLQSLTRVLCSKLFILSSQSLVMVDEMDVTTLSDEDETESIRQLQEALQVESASRHAAAIASAASSAGSSPRATDITPRATDGTPRATDAIARIESALAFNKLMDEKLQKLEHILAQRLEECRRKIDEIQKPLNSERDEVLQEFKYTSCGKPYFKDNNSYPAPENTDTLIMRKSGVFDTSNIVSISGWTIKDKRLFTSTILKFSREMVQQKLTTELNQLKNTYPENVENISLLEAEIEALEKKSLAELALPIDQEYDWELISMSLNGRHSPQEYRSLWRLFLHPSINKSHWTKQEKTELLELARKHDMQDWNTIAQELGTRRTGYQCFVYHRTNIENSLSGKKWSKEEEEYLKRLLEYYKNDNFVSWSKIASKMPNRTKMQIYTKYIQMSEKKGRFVKEEDEVILTCVEKFGPDFSRLSKILRGRSQSQLRRRYELLMKSNRVSAVWTLDEDRRLVQLIKDQDEAVNFADLVEMFPGKTRVHLRTRYITLAAWMKKHPRLDLAHAPRRGARRLPHGHVAESLPGALESLKKRMESDDEPKPVLSKQLSYLKRRITADSSEVAIEDGIVTILINEELRNQTQNSLERKNEFFDHSENVHRLLILLRAKMNRMGFQRSRQWSARLPGLLVTDTKELLQPRVQSYSKQGSTVNLGSGDIWGVSPLAEGERVLPPNRATLAACRRIMALVAAGSNAEFRPINYMCRKNPAFCAAWKKLLERFRLLFTWPLLLSNSQPAELMPCRMSLSAQHDVTTPSTSTAVAKDLSK